jgi:hypothetical protein
MWKSFWGQRTVSRTSGKVQPRIAPVVDDPEQVFLASIAHLSPEEQQKQLQKRQWYRRLAQRQGIMEMERHSDQYLRTGDQQYRVW